MLKAVTLKEIERIFTVVDALGVSREAVVIPLRPEHPGRVSLMKDGKLEIVVEREGDFEDWFRTLEERIRGLMNPEQD
jgi:predicted Rdx family selenoprotein